MFRDNYNFNAIMDEIFSPLEIKSVITIKYEALPCEINDEYIVDFRVRLVNGYHNPAEFGDQIYDHGNAFPDDIEYWEREFLTLSQLAKKILNQFYN